MAVEQKSWILLDPTIAAARTTVLSPRLDTLAGKTIGVIWNGRPPGDVLFERMFNVLRERHGLKEVIFRSKPFIGSPAPEPVFDELSAKCHAVVTGIGDWGSCTSGSVLDAITVERRGRPAAMVGAEKLVKTTGRGMAKLQGLPDFPLAVIAGYGLLDSIREEEAWLRVATDIANQVENILLKGHL